MIGMPYRLGAIPDRHGAADCLSLASAVVNFYGFESPVPQRDWYRRLKRGEYEVFLEGAERWGVKTETPRIGVVALSLAEKGYGFAVYWNDGWLSFVESEVRWSPLDLLPVVGLYYPRKPSSAILLD